MKMKNITTCILALLLSSMTDVHAESRLEDLNLAEDFPPDVEPRPNNSPQLSDTDFVDEDINESSGEDHNLSQTSLKKESIIYRAMLEALKRPEMSQQLSQVLPIVRSMTPPQRLTLATLLTAQVMSSPTSESPTLDQIIAMFGVGPQDGDDKRQNMTSSLLLPLSLDIANIFKGAVAKTPEALELRHLRVVTRPPIRRVMVTHVHPHPPLTPKTRTAVTFRSPLSSHHRRNVPVSTEMVPPPPPRPGTPTPQLGGKTHRPAAGKLPSGPLRPPAPERKHSSVGEGSTLSRDNCDYFTNTLCLEVSDYPKDAIIASIHRSHGAFEALLADVKQQPTDVTPNRMTSLREMRYAPDHAATEANRRQDHDNSLKDFGSEDGYLCPSSVKFARPKRARATSGQWKFIVNTGDYTQTLRLEMCQRPQEVCTFISSNFRSECSQVYNYHRLLTWDDVKGLHMDIFKVPTCCSCHVKGYAFNFPPRPTPESHDTSLRPGNFPGTDFVAEDHGIQQQNLRPSEGLHADFVDEPHLRPPLLTNSEQFHDESFSQTFNHDQDTRGPFNSNQITTGGQFQSGTSINQFQNQGHRNQLDFQRDSITNQFHFQNDETREQFENDNSRKHFQGEVDFRTPLHSPKREPVHFPKQPELHVTPPPPTFQVSTLFQKQGLRHPTPDNLLPPAGPPLPLAHETDFPTFTGNQLLRRSRNQTSYSIRDDVDLDVGETTVKTHLFPNGIPSEAVRNSATKSTTTVIATNSTTSEPGSHSASSKPSPTIEAEGKRVNYNYHPIIDYFRTQQSKSFKHGNTQEWTPIVGNTERLTKEA